MLNVSKLNYLLQTAYKPKGPKMQALVIGLNAYTSQKEAHRYTYNSNTFLQRLFGGLNYNIEFVVSDSFRCRTKISPNI